MHRGHNLNSAVLLRFAFACSLALSASMASGAAEKPRIVVTHLAGGVYLVEDQFYSPENSVFYVDEKSVTVVGATWTPETAKELVQEIRKVTAKPIREVIDPDFHLDRAGGNGYFKSIGVSVVSTRLTYEMLKQEWNHKVQARQKV